MDEVFDITQYNHLIKMNEENHKKPCVSCRRGSMTEVANMIFKSPVSKVHVFCILVTSPTRKNLEMLSLKGCNCTLLFK